MSQIITNINNLINEQVLIPIAEYLKSKGIKDVDVATLQGVLNIPVQATKTKGIRGPRHHDSAIVTDPENKCEYEYTKGGNKGQKCGKACVKGYNYCKGCMDKSGTQKHLEELGIPLPPFVVEKAKGKTNKSVGKKKQKDVVEEDDNHGAISGEPAKGKKNVYILREKGAPTLYFRSIPSGSVRVYGVYEKPDEDGDEEIREMDEKERQFAEERGFEVSDLDQMIEDEKADEEE